MKLPRLILTSLLAIASLWSNSMAAAEAPPPACVAASKALNQWIIEQHGQVRLSDLETSAYADDLRMACDGTPEAYQKSLAEIMRPWQPEPASPNAFRFSEAAEGMLSVALITGLAVASGGAVFGLYSGAMAISIFGSDDDISNR